MATPQNPITDEELRNYKYVNDLLIKNDIFYKMLKDAILKDAILKDSMAFWLKKNREDQIQLLEQRLKNEKSNATSENIPINQMVAILPKAAQELVSETLLKCEEQAKKIENALSEIEKDKKEINDIQATLNTIQTKIDSLPDKAKESGSIFHASLIEFVVRKNKLNSLKTELETTEADLIKSSAKLEPLKTEMLEINKKFENTNLNLKDKMKLTEQIGEKQQQINDVIEEQNNYLRKLPKIRDKIKKEQEMLGKLEENFKKAEAAFGLQGENDASHLPSRNLNFNFDNRQTKDNLNSRTRVGVKSPSEDLMKILNIGPEILQNAELLKKARDKYLLEHHPDKIEEYLKTHREEVNKCLKENPNEEPREKIKIKNQDKSAELMGKYNEFKSTQSKTKKLG